MTEQSIEERRKGKTAEEQGSEIPLGWVPTAAEPVPVVRCHQIKKDGFRCKNWSIRGYTKCRKHAGPQLLMKDGNVQKYAEAIIESAKLRLVDDADMAIDALTAFISQPGTSEGIRLKAATEILDRAGVRGGVDLQVDVQVSQNPGMEVNERLKALRSGALAVERMKSEARKEQEQEHANIVEGVVVEDEDEQGTLF